MANFSCCITPRFNSWALEVVEPGVEFVRVCFELKFRADEGLRCNNIGGAFQVLSLALQNGIVTDFTATFSQTCDNEGPILGCLHYAPP